MPTVNNTNLGFQMILEKANAVVLFVLQASIFHKSVEISAFWQRYRSIRIGSFPRRVSMVIFIYNQKPFVRRRLRRYRLRHKIHAIKTRLNNPLRFLQRKNSIRRYLVNDLTCATRKTTFRTRNRFHNKQYTPKSKDQPFESDRTHFDIEFNKSNVAMHRPTIIFLLSHKITTVQQKTTKTINQIKQSEKTIPATTQSKTLSKQTVKTNHNKQTRQTISSINRKINHKNNHNKQSTQSLKKTRSKQTIITNTTSNYEKMQYFLNIKISQTATSSEPTAKDKTTYYTLR